MQYKAFDTTDTGHDTNVSTGKLLMATFIRLDFANFLGVLYFSEVIFYSMLSLKCHCEVKGLKGGHASLGKTILSKQNKKLLMTKRNIIDLVQGLPGLRLSLEVVGLALVSPAVSGRGRVPGHKPPHRETVEIEKQLVLCYKKSGKLTL